MKSIFSIFLVLALFTGCAREMSLIDVEAPVSVLVDVDVNAAVDVNGQVSVTVTVDGEVVVDLPEFLPSDLETQLQGQISDAITGLNPSEEDLASIEEEVTNTIVDFLAGLIPNNSPTAKTMHSGAKTYTITAPSKSKHDVKIAVDVKTKKEFRDVACSGTGTIIEKALARTGTSFQQKLASIYASNVKPALCSNGEKSKPQSQLENALAVLQPASNSESAIVQSTKTSRGTSLIDSTPVESSQSPTIHL